MNIASTSAITGAYDHALDTIGLNIKTKNEGRKTTSEESKKSNFSLYDAVGIAKDVLAIVEGRKTMGGVIDAVTNAIKKFKSWFK